MDKIRQLEDLLHKPALGSYLTPEQRVKNGSRNPLDLMKSKLLTIDELRTKPKPKYLLDGIIPENSIGMLYGASGWYKSFVALAQSICIAEGIPWEADGFYSVNQRNVVYVAGEGDAGIPKRVNAWEQWNQHRVGSNILWYPAPVNLMKPEEVSYFAQAIVDHSPGLIWFDTLAKCAVGGDENSSKDMGVVTNSMLYLQHALHCTSALVHHTTKDGESYRGSSALYANVDWAMEVKPNGKNQILLRGDKQKDDEKFAAIGLEAHKIGEGEDSSLVLRYAPQITMGAKSDTVVLSLIADMSAVEAVLSSQVQKKAEADHNIQYRTYYRVVTRLIKNELVENIGTEKQARLRVTKKGALACGVTGSDSE